MFCFFRSAVRVKQFLFLLPPLAFSFWSIPYIKHKKSKRTQLFFEFGTNLFGALTREGGSSCSTHSFFSFHKLQTLRLFQPSFSLLASPSLSLLCRFYFCNTSSKANDLDVNTTPSSGELTREIPPHEKKKQIQATFGL